jgi:alkylated DNA nucleotide flippase Atl1
MSHAQDTRTDFSKKSNQVHTGGPQSKVATYSLIAELAGNPAGSRAIARYMYVNTWILLM